MKAGPYVQIRTDGVLPGEPQYLPQQEDEDIGEVPHELRKLWRVANQAGSEGFLLGQAVARQIQTGELQQIPADLLEQTVINLFLWRMFGVRLSAALNRPDDILRVCKGWRVVVTHADLGKWSDHVVEATAALIGARH